MKKYVFLASASLFLLATSIVYASNSNVNVNSSVSSNESNHYQSKTNTKVDINQTGEGTSKVTINGETWEQVGPGSINVEKTTDNSNSSINSSPAPSADPSPSSSPTVTVEIEESGDGNFLEDIFDKIKQIFDKLF